MLRKTTQIFELFAITEILQYSQLYLGTPIEIYKNHLDEIKSWLEFN